MAVKAYRIVTVGADQVKIERTFECGQFDLMDEVTPGVWTEVWRNCDLGVNPRRTLWPFASGLIGIADIDISLPARTRHWKDFGAGIDDSFTSELDLSDTNGGVLPSDHCRWMEVYQNGKKLQCRGYTVTHTPPAKVVIDPEWRVPGASYEVVFWEAISGGVPIPST